MDLFQTLIPYAHTEIFDDDIESYVDQLQEEYMELNTPRHGGSKPGKKPNRPRDFSSMNKRFYDDFFSETPLYSEEEFRSRYRMYRSVYLKVHDAVLAYDPWFALRQDATKKWGASSYIKVAAAIRKLAYGTANVVWGEIYQLSGALVWQSVDHFITAIVAVMKDTVISPPTLQDCIRLSEENGARGFPGCLGSIDCQHWYWAMCPSAHHGHYLGKPGKPTVVLEAVCDRNLYFSHADFGFPGSLNDISIVTRSSFIARHIDGHFPPRGFSYTLNGVERTTPYYLADGIYPEWSIFLQAIKQPLTTKEKLFTTLQESVRKDIERAFGVMHKRWGILRNKSQLWSVEKMARCMYACLILHNLIIESYGLNDLSLDENLRAELDTTEEEIHRSYDSSQHFYPATQDSMVADNIDPEFSLFAHLHDESSGIMSPSAWLRLRQESINHIWAARGDAV
jgi:hypothetical protein